jgi:hypothetical protein
MPFTQDYVRQMIRVFETAEDLEMLEELHTLCNMMTIIRESWVEGVYPVSAT